MNSMDVQDLLSIDMDELGVRPLTWNDRTKKFDSSIEELFGKDKTTDIHVYSAEYQSKDDDIGMSDEDDDDYEIDPETGEKIFHETSSKPNISLSPSNDKWIEEYLSNIESSSSNSILPLTTNQSELLDDSDWLDNILNFDDARDSIRMNSIHNPSSILNVPTEDEYSINNSNQSQEFEVHQHPSNSIRTDSNDMALLETKFEKLDQDISPMLIRQSTVRASIQGQIDDNILQQNEIPLTVDDITQSTTDEYNRHLTRLNYLTSEQIHVIKDIRRRGKNKIAAQNCRKRKAVSIETLLDDVDELKRVKHELEERKRAYQQQIIETRNQYEYLHQQILPNRQLPPAIIVK